MAKEKSMTVIKKITISGGGHHGGAWKVAFADFMTAMMAFFLCMWLLSISPEARQSISDYFSTPSVIEYEFRNFGVELTLEKMFADLLNEPLDAVSKLIEPMDKTPNVFEFNNDKIAMSFIMEKIGDEAKNVEINNNEISFVIPDFRLFKTGSSETSNDFIPIMDKIKKVVNGLEQANIRITSQLFLDGVPNENQTVATEVATARLDLIKLNVKSSLEHESTQVDGFIDVKPRKDNATKGKTPLTGFLRFDITRFVDKNKTEGSLPNFKKENDRENEIENGINKNRKNDNSIKESQTQKNEVGIKQINQNSKKALDDINDDPSLENTNLESDSSTSPKSKDLYDDLNDSFRREINKK